MNMRREVKLAVWLLVAQIWFISSARSVTVNAGEQAEAKRWADAKFSGKIEPVPGEDYLALVGGRGRIERNSRDGRPLRIFDTRYARGLYLDGAQGVLVHLTSPAKTFEAIVGLDGSYAGCSYTNASQEFSVQAGEKVVFPATVIKVATPGVPVKAQLNGATAFTMQNGQDPQKEWCREAVWADARVTLENGSTLWLGDLSVGSPVGPFTALSHFPSPMGESLRLSC